MLEMKHFELGALPQGAGTPLPPVASHHPSDGTPLPPVASHHPSYCPLLSSHYLAPGFPWRHLVQVLALFLSAMTRGKEQGRRLGVGVELIRLQLLLI